MDEALELRRADERNPDLENDPAIPVGDNDTFIGPLIYSALLSLNFFSITTYKVVSLRPMRILLTTTDSSTLCSSP